VSPILKTLRDYTDLKQGYRELFFQILCMLGQDKKKHLESNVGYGMEPNNVEVSGT
jgi:hypothetical protein